MAEEDYLNAKVIQDDIRKKGTGSSTTLRLVDVVISMIFSMGVKAIQKALRR